MIIIGEDLHHRGKKSPQNPSRLSPSKIQNHPLFDLFVTFTNSAEEKTDLKKNHQGSHVDIIAALEPDQNDLEIVAEVEVEIVIQDREEVETEMIVDEIEVEIDHVIEIEDEDNCPITQYESYFSSFLFVFHLSQLLRFNKLYEFGKFILRTP